jgi:hypothetical protein
MTEDPTTYKQAISRPDREMWIHLMESEINSLMEKETWILVKKPDRAKLLDAKWVYKVKRNPDGNVDKYKARLVIRGFRQEHAVDYFETFSTVARYESIRLLLALAAAHSLHIHHSPAVPMQPNFSLTKQKCVMILYPIVNSLALSCLYHGQPARIYLSP